MVEGWEHWVGGGAGRGRGEGGETENQVVQKATFKSPNDRLKDTGIGTTQNETYMLVPFLVYPQIYNG